MQYKVLTAEEAAAQAFPMAPAGEYDFEIKAAQDKVSKNGQDMIELQLKVYNANGDEFKVRDFILPDHEQMGFRLRQLCECIGMVDTYEASELETYMLTGKCGRVKTKVNPAEGKYDASASVARYMKPVDGHDASEVVRGLENAANATRGPVKAKPSDGLNMTGANEDPFGDINY